VELFEDEGEESDAQHPPGSPRRKGRKSTPSEEDPPRLVTPTDLSIPYSMDKVPQVKMDKKKGTMIGSVMYRPKNRHDWYAATGEMYALCAEAALRRGNKLGREPSAPLPAAYITDRIDIDDPLRGFHVRDAKTGWMQGLVTHTTFTHWTRYFKWDSLHPESGVKEAGAAVNNEEALAVYHAEEDDTPEGIAASQGVKLEELLEVNSGRYAGLRENSRLKEGTTILIPPKDRSKKEKDKLLKARKVDLNGSLAKQLQACECNGNPEAEGVVTPRVCEIGLLGGLGCGSWLMSLALEELATEYDYAVLQATLGSVTFYEKFGFRRVGAVAKYAEKGIDIKKAELVGYRHWTFKDEKQLDAHGGPSYMMCLKLKKGDTGLIDNAKKLIVDTPPPVKEVKGIRAKNEVARKQAEKDARLAQLAAEKAQGKKRSAGGSMSDIRAMSRLGRQPRESGGRALYNKIVKVSGDKEATKKGFKYWFVLHYERERGLCHVCPLRDSGHFRGRGDRTGHIRWKAVSESEGMEMKVKADCCEVMRAEAVNKTTDVDKETWDILDDSVAVDLDEDISFTPKSKKRKGEAASPGGSSKKAKVEKGSKYHEHAVRLGKLLKGKKGTNRIESPEKKGRITNKKPPPPPKVSSGNTLKDKVGQRTGKSGPFSVLIGNSHRVLHRKKVSTELGETVMHKWTAFVECEDEAESIDKVVFHLHPSFTPSVIEVTHAPFEVKQVGWGVFDIKVDIHRSNGRIHHHIFVLSFLDDVNTEEVEFK